MPWARFSGPLLRKSATAPRERARRRLLHQRGVLSVRKHGFPAAPVKTERMAELQKTTTPHTVGDGPPDSTLPERPLRVAVVGPVPPLRSGVARHTGAIARAFEGRANTDVRVWSFSRQYPPGLYPGGDEKNPDAAGTAPKSVRLSLDGINPMSWRQTAREVTAWRPDVVVIPAWTFFLAPALGMIARATRRSGAHVSIVVHNVFDHETAAWKAKLSHFQLRQAHSFVTHNTAMADALNSAFADTPTAVFPHPVFDDLPDAPPVDAADRKPLELLFFGIVRPYKGLPFLIDALSHVARKDWRLTIAGEFWEGRAEIERKIAAAGLGGHIHLRDEYLSDREAAAAFAAADAALLPYRSATGSGVIPTAYRYGCPVVVSDLPGLSSAVVDGKTGWVLPKNDARAWARHIDGLAPDALNAARQAAREHSRDLGWDAFIDLILGQRAG